MLATAGWLACCMEVSGFPDRKEKEFRFRSALLLLLLVSHLFPVSRTEILINAKRPLLWGLVTKKKARTAREGGKSWVQFTALVSIKMYKL